MSTKLYFAPAAEKTHSLDEGGERMVARRILILDDDAPFAQLTAALLRENGYEVDTACDGVEGIKKIMAGDYAVILCDMVMPNCAGDMFYTAVQRVKPHLCKRFIFMTGHRGDRKIDDFIRGIKGLAIWKPFQNHVLMESIRLIEEKSR